MKQQTKYYDSKKIVSANKETISFRMPKYLVDNLKAYSILKDATLTDIVTGLLADFFSDKTVTNDYIICGDLYFNLPLDKKFKDDAIANKIKLNQDREPTDTEQILIKAVPNNLDMFNGVTYTANLDDNTIKHIGIDFKIIHSENIINELVKFPITDITLTDFLFVFYYEVSTNNNVDVYLINPIDAVNRLSCVNHGLGSVLIECLQEMEFIQNEIYHSEMQGLEPEQNTNRNYKLLNDVLTELSKKYNNPNIIYGSDLLKENTIKLGELIERMKAEHEINQRIIKYKSKTE